MRSNRIAIMLFPVILFIAGCVNLKPTVKELRQTVEDMRTRDYETGRVVLSKNKALNKRGLTTRLERMMDAENNAAVALGEDKPFPDVKKAAETAVTKALKKDK